MTTTSKATKKFKLSTVVAGIKAKHPAIEIETDDGTFIIPPPQLWSDDIIAVAADPIAGAKALLGNQYGAFVAAGGSAAILMQVIAEATGSDLGESSAS